MAHDHHLSTHLQVEEHRRDITSKAPSVCPSLRSGMVFKFVQSEGSLLQRTQNGLSQFCVLRQPRSGPLPPSSPRLAKGLRISCPQRIEDRIVFGEQDRSAVGPMSEELLFVPQ